MVAAAKGSIAKKDYDRAIIELQKALQETPQSAEANYQLGIALLERGDAGRSIRYFRSAVDLLPSHTDARLKLAELLNASGDKELASRAEVQAKAALEQRPDDPEVLHTLAVAEWRQEKSKAAIEHLEMALARNPAHLTSSVTLAMVYWSINRDAVAGQRTLERAVRNASNSEESMLALGRFLALAGKAKEAEAEFQQVLRLHPGSGKALFEIAKLQQSSGNKAGAAQTLARLSALPDRSFRTAHARFLFQNGERDAAIAELRQLSGKEPDNREVRSLLVDFYLESAKLAEAEEVLKTGLARDANDPDLFEQQGRLYLLQRRYQSAEEAATTALRLRPRSASAHYIRAQAYRGLDRRIDYVQELRLALDQNPALIPARVELSQSHRSSKSLRDAMEVIEAAPASVSREFPILLERAWVQFASGKLSDSRLTVDKALAISRQPQPLVLAGLIAMQEHRLPAGRALLEEALESDPVNVDALKAIALSLLAEKNSAAATARVRKQAARLPNSAAIQFLLGEWLEQTRDAQGARLAYAAALKADPAFAPAVVASARMAMTQGQWENAKQALQSVLAKDPRNVDALLAMGMLEESTGQNDAAIKTYRAVLKIDNTHIVAKNNLAIRLSEIPASRDEALVLALQVKESAPGNPEIEDTVGWAYFKKGDFPTAIKYFENATSRTNDPRMRYRLAMAYFGAGNRPQGEKALAAAEALNPNLPEAAQARSMAQKAR